MKKEISETILHEIIKLNSRMFNMEGKMGEMKEEMKLNNRTLKEHGECMDSLETKVENGFDTLSNDVRAIYYMLDEASDWVKDHEKRIDLIETVKG